MPIPEFTIFIEMIHFDGIDPPAVLFHFTAQPFNDFRLTGSSRSGNGHQERRAACSNHTPDDLDKCFVNLPVGKLIFPVSNVLLYIKPNLPGWKSLIWLAAKMG